MTEEGVVHEIGAIVDDGRGGAPDVVGESFQGLVPLGLEGPELEITEARVVPVKPFLDHDVDGLVGELGYDAAVPDAEELVHLGGRDAEIIESGIADDALFHGEEVPGVGVGDDAFVLTCPVGADDVAALMGD